MPDKKNNELRNIENQEWLDSIDYIISQEDPERIKEIVDLVWNRAVEKGFLLDPKLNTPYINTIHAEKNQLSGKS